MRRWLAVLLVVMGLLAAACGSSSPKSSSSTTAGSSGGKGSGKVTVGRFSFPGGSATGSPIKLGDIQSVANTPNFGPAEDAAVSYVNAELGGVNGHPLQIVHCDEKVSPAVAATCSQQFIQEGVVGVIGFPLVWDSVSLTTMEQAGIPDLAADSSGLPAYSCSICHTLGGGYPAYAGAQVKWAAEQGFKSVAIITVNVPGAINAGKWSSDRFKENGIKTTTNLSHANAAPDVTTNVRQAVATNPDAIMLIDGPQDCGREVVAAAQAGFKGKLLLTPNCATGGVISSMGAAANQTVYSSFNLSYEDSSNPEVAAYQKAMSQYHGPSPDFNTLQAFSNVLTVAAAMEHISGTVTASAVNQYFASTPSIPVWAGYALIQRNTPPDPAYKAFLDSFDRVFTWNGSSYVDAGKWYSIWFTAQSGVGAS